MRHRNRPLFKRSNNGIESGNSLFSIIPLIPQIVIIAIVCIIYYYINLKDLFPLWSNYITYGVKFIIALEIIIAAAKTLTGPLLAIALGALDLYLIRYNGLEIISPDNAEQLMLIGGVGILITFIVRALRR